MNHPSSTSTLDSTLCHRSNHRPLPSSPCIAPTGETKASLSDFSCRFLLIKFQTPNKAYSLAGAVSVIRRYPSSASQTSTQLCRAVGLLFYSPASATGRSQRSHSTSLAATLQFPYRCTGSVLQEPNHSSSHLAGRHVSCTQIKRHISSLRRLDDLLLATRACKAQLWCGKSLSL
jgi:hypothetical protein